MYQSLRLKLVFWMQAFCSLHELHVPCGSFINLAHSGTLRYFSIAGRSARAEHKPGAQASGETASR